MRAARCVVSSIVPSVFAGFRVPPGVITLAVRWYLRFGLSYRDVEELLAERGVDVDQGEAVSLRRELATASWSAQRGSLRDAQGKPGALRRPGATG